MNAVRISRANGQIEKANQVILMHLRTTTGKTTDWDKKLRNLQFTIKVLDKDRYLISDIDEIQRTQKPFHSIFTRDKIKLWCKLFPEADEEDDEN